MRNTSLLVAPSEPAIENDLPLDLSCNGRRSDEDEVVAGAGIGGPPSPPRSPTDFNLLGLGYVVYHQQLLAKERQRQWHLQQQQQQQHNDDVDDEDDDDDDDDVDVTSPSANDSDDSDSHPIDLGANPKAYKKSLMKRYRKSLANNLSTFLAASSRV